MLARCLALCVCAVACLACFRHEPRSAPGGDTTAAAAAPNPPPPMRVYLEQTRVLDSVLVLAALGDVARTIVLSLDTAAHSAPPGVRFDRAQVFAWNPADSSWHTAASDSILWGVGVALRDVTGDGNLDLVVTTTTDLDDSIAGRGMVIFSADNGAWHAVFRLAGGAPELRDVDNNGTPEILVHDTYAGVMPATDAVPFLSDLYSFDGTAFSSALTRFPTFVQDHLARREEDYARVKTQVPVTAPINDEFDFTLYRPCAAFLISCGAAGDRTRMQQFWGREKDYLARMLPPGQYVDLEALAEAH